MRLRAPDVEIRPARCATLLDDGCQHGFRNAMLVFHVVADLRRGAVMYPVERIAVMDEIERFAARDFGHPLVPKLAP